VLYEFDITIPANTAKADWERVDCLLTYGIIRHVEVAFPPGPYGLAHVVIYRFEHQVWPTNPESDFAWDNYTIAFDEEFALDVWPYTMSVRGWNEDDTYQHTVTVRFEIGGREWSLADLMTLQTPYSYLSE